MPATPTPTGGWSDVEQVSWYLDRIDRLGPRAAGEQVLVDVLPPEPRHVLDLGCGDGRLARLVMESRPSVERVMAVDRSRPMLARARQRFASDPRVELVPWDLNQPLGPWGPFDVVVSGFAIHHLTDARKRGLFAEIASLLVPGGLFVNLEVVASASPARHAEFLAAIGRTADDPEDCLALVEDQTRWMAEAGLEDVDCLWRWRGFALLAGTRAPA